MQSGGSGVRIPQLPHQTSKKFEVFLFPRVRGSPVVLRDQLPHKTSKKFEVFLCLPPSKKETLAEGRGSPVILRDQLPHQVPNFSGFFLSQKI